MVVTQRLPSYSTNSDRGRSAEDKLGQQESRRKSNKEELNIEQHKDEWNWHLAHSRLTRNAHKILTGKSEGNTYVSGRQREKNIFTYIHTVHLDIIKVFYSPTDGQMDWLKNDFKNYIKIDIKTAPTCFGAVTPSSWSTLLVLGKVTVVKIAN